MGDHRLPGRALVVRHRTRPFPSSGTVEAVPTAGGDPQQVASGLWWPHGIAVSPHGQLLYVAENGINGDIVSMPVAFDPDSPPQRVVEHVRYAEAIAPWGDDLYYAGNAEAKFAHGVRVHEPGQADANLCDRTSDNSGLAVAETGEIY